MRARLWEIFTRLYWHGWPGDWADFLRLTLVDTVLASRALDRVIERSNEGDGGGRPKDQR